MRVVIAEDNALLREGLVLLLTSAGHEIVAVAGAEPEILPALLTHRPDIAVLDVRMPEMSGIELMDRLHQRGINIPIIFLTAHGDVPMAVRAMKAGAVDFLTKPFRDQEMLDAVVRALERDQKRIDSQKVVADLRVRFDSLTSREREVIAFVIDGLMNKQIAAKLGVTEITVKVHRVNMMRKMRARSVIELVGMADLLGLRHPKS